MRTRSRCTVLAHTSRIVCWKAQVPSKLTPLQNSCKGIHPQTASNFLSSETCCISREYSPTQRHILLGLIICIFFCDIVVEVYLHLFLAENRSVIMSVTAFAEMPVTISICDFRAENKGR